MKKRDFIIAGIAGFFTAIFVLFIARNSKINIGYFLSLAFIVGLPVLWMLVIAVAGFLKKWFNWFYQLAKFCVVGFLNASVDIGVLNLLSALSGITSGFTVGGVNIPGFIAAAANSYFWNKFWVFKKKETAGEATSYKDIYTFIPVVISGILVNSGIVVFISTYVNPFAGLSASQWLNVSKITASALALLWNFVGFKIFVFRPKADSWFKPEINKQ